jgi:N-acetyl-anhydromuramyl-L-alanine amidase AmpD
MAEMTVPLVSRGNGRWGSPSPAWDHLINRESSGIPDIIQQIQDVNSGGNEAEGLFQITPKTWQLLKGTDFAPSARRATPQQQAIVAARIFTRNPSGSDWGAGRPGREDPRELAAGLVPLATTEGPAVPDNRPDFNEYEMWSPNNQDRGGTRVDLFLLHTQEGDGNADSLAKYLQGHEVSYHYTISEDFNDHGVTVVDVVDTDQASWSVLSANNRSINLCFAGSRASWSRQQWLQQSKAIDVAAYLAVQDAKKYGFSPRVMSPPYNSNPPGISDHRYVTQWLKDGTHTDVGLNFPWDVFEAAVRKYANGAAPGPVTPPTFRHPPVDQMIAEIWDQLRGPEGKGWPQLGGKTLVDAVAELRKL